MALFMPMAKEAVVCRGPLQGLWDFHSAQLVFRKRVTTESAFACSPLVPPSAFRLAHCAPGANVYPAPYRGCLHMLPKGNTASRSAGQSTGGIVKKVEQLLPPTPTIPGSERRSLERMGPMATRPN